MTCAVTLGPGLAGLSKLIETGHIKGTQLFAEYCKECPKAISDAAFQAAVRKIDDKAMCQVMCCCKSASSGGRAARQECVKQTLDAADDICNGQSRYKAEISYNMKTNPPEPFMHRDASGNNTTRRSDYWQGRARSEIEDYQQGVGDVRRPDVVIVNDPKKPPTQDNITRVVEMKFKGDGEGVGQYAAYERIAGSPMKFDPITEESCKCGEDGKRVPDPIVVYVPETKKQPKRDWAWLETLGWGVATAGLAVVTIAALVCPVDGPAGEIAAGTGTAAAAARFAAAWARTFAPAAGAL